MDSLRGDSRGTRLPFDVGMAHYDQAPPDEIEDLDELRRSDRFRFANRLSASIQVNASGEIIAASYTGGRHDREHDRQTRTGQQGL